MTTEYQLFLFVAGGDGRLASTLRTFFDQSLGENQYRLDVVDIIQEPKQARMHKILSVPTLIKQSPLPVQRLAGNLFELEEVARELRIAWPVPLIQSLHNPVG